MDASNFTKPYSSHKFIKECVTCKSTLRPLLPTAFSAPAHVPALPVAHFLIHSFMHPLSHSTNTC